MVSCPPCSNINIKEACRVLLNLLFLSIQFVQTFHLCAFCLLSLRHQAWPSPAQLHYLNLAMTLLNTPETPPWWRNAEGCGLLSLEKRGLWGDLIANFQRIKGAYMKGRDKHLPRPLATGQRIMVLNWEGLGLGWTWRDSLLWGWWGTGRGCSGKLWMPCLWKCSIPGCMGLWATWSSARCHGCTI